jgi:hypothetical protein
MPLQILLRQSPIHLAGNNSTQVSITANAFGIAPGDYRSQLGVRTMRATTRLFPFMMHPQRINRAYLSIGMFLSMV